MDRRRLRNTFLPLVAFFVLVNAACFAWTNDLLAKGIDPVVIQVANMILFLLALISARMHFRSVKQPNPNAFVRSIMAAMLMKLLVLAGSVLVYVYLAGATRNVPGILIGMGLYIVYSIMEVSGAFRLNKSKDGVR